MIPFFSGAYAGSVHSYKTVSIRTRCYRHRLFTNPLYCLLRATFVGNNNKFCVLWVFFPVEVWRRHRCTKQGTFCSSAHKMGYYCEVYTFKICLIATTKMKTFPRLPVNPANLLVFCPLVHCKVPAQLVELALGPNPLFLSALQPVLAAPVLRDLHARSPPDLLLLRCLRTDRWYSRGESCGFDIDTMRSLVDLRAIDVSLFVSDGLFCASSYPAPPRPPWLYSLCYAS